MDSLNVLGRYELHFSVNMLSPSFTADNVAHWQFLLQPKFLTVNF